MKRSAKVCWIGFVFSTVVIAAVAGLVVYFTAFRNDAAAGASVPAEDLRPVGSNNAEPGNGLAATNNGLDDHRSHSVPGGAYKVVDYDDDGKEALQLDGAQSHTHYYNAGPPIVVGKIVTLTWFDNTTREVIAQGAAPQVSFDVGTTIIGLTVEDNTRDAHTGYTTVVVKSPVSEGAYCYFYEASSADAGITLSADLTDAAGPKPIFAAIYDGIAFADIDAFELPGKLAAESFQARCVYQVEGGRQLSLALDHYGPVRVLLGNEEVISESTGDGEASTPGSVSLPDGTQVLQVLYFRKSTAGAKLQLTAGDEGMQLDQSKVLPVLTGSDTASSTLDGGGTLILDGRGLANGLSIMFGAKSLKPDSVTPDGRQVVVTVPKASSVGAVSITAVNKVGVSNALPFDYSENGLAPIKFTEDRVLEGSKPFKIALITGIKYGPDHRYYLSAINSVVHSFAANSDLKVSDVCESESLGAHRSILGLAFNPAETTTRLYVSASVLDWKSKDYLSGARAWANGEILVLEPNYKGKCLGKLDKPIITGLPVSNHDHGVNGMVFDQEGNLHIQVGGFTNAGHNKADSRLGGIDENPLSGASLIAPVMKPGFNGNIDYDSDEPGIASQIAGDVSVFSPGWRNSFGITIHSNGFLYATDNGASTGFGDLSTSCENDAPHPKTNMPDKLGKVLKGKYAGHPNRNRGRKDPDQCVFKRATDPESGNYSPPLTSLESSTDGILEYTASCFGGRLRGDLLLTKYSTDQSPGLVYRVQLDDNGELKAEPSELWPASGLSIEMSPWGDLLMPRVYKDQIIVMRPTYTVPSGPSLTAVLPFRGPAKGGNVVIVTGHNFGSQPTAKFGDKPCIKVTDVASDGRSFMCQVPEGTKDEAVAVVVEADGEKSKSHGDNPADYKYMNV